MSTINRIILVEQSAPLVKGDLPKWYRELFSPSLAAGLITPEALIGFRNDRVMIRGSLHTPLPKEALIDAMEAFFNCLLNEEHPAVRAILGHFTFVFIHPYMDGNGRIARFLMNAMLISGGYNWTVIHVEKRERYFNCLEMASVKFNIKPFAKFVKSELEHSKKYIK